MPSYQHNKLIERVSQIDELPDNVDEYSTWIKADEHLDLLQENAQEDELIIYCSGDYTFIYTVVVSEDNVYPLDQDDLLRWSGNPSSPRAGYAYGFEKDDVWIERTDYPSGSKTLEGAKSLVFVRDFQGLKENNASYYEIQQEYSHLTEIHWRPEQHAYCRFDENGDFDHIVSVTYRESKGEVALISFKREPLELYLAASNSVLIRMFDFTLFRRGQFTSWSDGPENIFNERGDFFYRQKVDDGRAAYTRGVQIVRPSRQKSEIFSSYKKGQKEEKHVEFVAYDWRNERISKISTDPTATTNYFQAHENSLPFELSPAFFRPDVLLKYKGDNDKYAVDERDIHCRGAWTLRGYDVNEAGQVHAYICYLRNLPYQEQLHWLSYNENPKTGISKRAIANDFQGKFTDPNSFEDVLIILRRWAESDFPWWRLRNNNLFERAGIPHTDSRDEWSGAFMNLSKLIIEGFQIKVIRKKLEERDITFNDKEQSLLLLEKFLTAHCKIDENQKLGGLRTVQNIRSTYAHSSSNKARNLANAALKEHGTYAGHFKSVCTNIRDELELIEQAFS